MKMRPVEGGLEIKPGETVTLKPGSLHVMFMDLKHPLETGSMVEATLQFEKAGTVEVDLPDRRDRGRRARRHDRRRLHDAGRRHDAVHQALTRLLSARCRAGRPIASEVAACGALFHRRFAKWHRPAFGQRHAKDVKRHRYQHVVAEDADQLDHAGIAEQFMHASVGGVAYAAGP